MWSRLAQVGPTYKVFLLLEWMELTAQLMVIDISAIISILGPLNSDLLTDKLLENYKHKQRAVHWALSTLTA